MFRKGTGTKTSLWYNEELLKKNGIKNAPSLPKVAEDEDYDEEDEDEYIEHNHDLIQHLTIKLVSPQQIKEINTVSASRKTSMEVRTVVVPVTCI